jgi:hypothetical protein
MSAPVKHLSVAEINETLADIAVKERAYKARDFDAELRKVMVEGGDIDALETAQLEAEKLARRLRVHRSALEADLPLAIEREGKEQISRNLSRHREMAEVAKGQANDVVTAWRAFMVALEAWEASQLRAQSLTTETFQIATDSGATMPEMGNLMSRQIMLLNCEAAFLDRRLLSAEYEMPVGTRVQGYRIDG